MRPGLRNPRLYDMRSRRAHSPSLVALALLCGSFYADGSSAQTAAPAGPSAAATNVGSSSNSSTSSAPANPITLPVVVSDKRGWVKDLGQNSFSLIVEGKPQTVRSVTRSTEVPLTVGLLVDISRSQDGVLDEEQKASQSFFESLLTPASGGRAADKAFIMQFGHTAELLQDVTDSRSLLGSGLKQIGTTAPDTNDEDATDTSTNGSNNGSGNSGSNGGGNSPNNPNNPNNGGYGRGPYGRNGGGASGNGNSSGAASQKRSGSVLYDAIFLASDDVLRRQKGRHVLILVTDGHDRHSKGSLKDAIEAAQRADTVVYAIYYKDTERNRGFSNGYPGGGGYDPYDPYGGGYGGYGRPGYPGGGSRPGGDGTYADPDGRKILTRICAETGGREFEVKGKGAIEKIYAQIGDELRAGYVLEFQPAEGAAATGYHNLQLSLTSPDAKKDDVQARQGYYVGAAKRQ